MSAATDNKVVSALSAITSLASSLLPNAIDLQQLNHLISNLIQMPSSGQTLSKITPLNNGHTFESEVQNKREKHRLTERVRHNTIIELIKQLSHLIGIHERHETQANVLNRAARYVIFLSHVIEKLETDSNNQNIDISSDEWLQSLYPIYERAFEEAKSLIESSYEENNCVSESSLDSSEALNRSRDHCFPLISMAIKK